MFRFAAICAVVAMMALGVYGGAVLLFPGMLPAVAGLGASNVPSVISHQGVVAVNGTRFNGTGGFKFAIVNPATGVNVWTNDGSRITAPDQTGEPASGVNLTVVDGVYSVALGGGSMAAMSPGVFAEGNLVLRVWFNDGTHNWQQLSPDQPLASVPYAMSVADGAVTTAKVQDGAITNAKLAAEVATVPTGSLIATARATAPDGWLICDGSAVSRITYAALFDAVGVSYGAGNGSTTFNLPDLRGRIPMGAGQGVGNGTSGSGAPSGTALTNRPLGSWAGSETHVLSIQEMPSHSHDSTDLFHDYNGGGSSYSFMGRNTSTIVSNPFKTANRGGGQAHNNVQPFQAVNWIIKY